jgi:hypothetical protein
MIRTKCLFLAMAILAAHGAHAADDADCKASTSGDAEGTSTRHLAEPSVRFGAINNIEHDMVGSTIALKIGGVELAPVSLTSEIGQRFTLTDGTGRERWELKARSIRQSDGSYLLDALVKCGDDIVAQQKLAAKPGESATLKVVAQTCPGKRKSLQADVNMGDVKGKVAAVVDVPSFRAWFKVFVDEKGKARSVRFLRTQPTMPMTQDAKDDWAATLLTWNFKPPVVAGKIQSGYVIVPVTVN